MPPKAERVGVYSWVVGAVEGGGGGWWVGEKFSMRQRWMVDVVADLERMRSVWKVMLLRGISERKGGVGGERSGRTGGRYQSTKSVWTALVEKCG